jgi:hypothetical protein
LKLCVFDPKREKKRGEEEEEENAVSLERDMRV